MSESKITVSTEVLKPISEVWKKWTNAADICAWNFAHESWHCPKAENDLRIGGNFTFTMAAKDESFSFDFIGTYTQLEKEKHIQYRMGDGRMADIHFEKTENGTRVTEIFDPEQVNPIAMQEQGWQAILHEFKRYVEAG